ncbi:hypothetical protein LC608_32730 [Nostoc sp. XA010]|uniref:hypothetical protein n=1 Tax=Nostoc sp. XA010 TaxID=2780407 RepID=UPI001E4C755A|nr:hypothetical protein [Nostoc sp. XA010]MCC5661630.1 hypothetical protein [Nostoc sp. XA010]
MIKQEMADAIAYGGAQPIAQIKDLIEKYDGGVALTKQEAISVEQQVLPDYSAIRENILNQLIFGVSPFV